MAHLGQEHRHIISQIFHALNLLVASGVTSEPNMPVLRGEEQICGLIIHQEAFDSLEVLDSPIIKSMTVLAGAQSSADMI